MTPFPAETSIFDTIAGLPVHPLAVHAAVVLLPLVSLGVLLTVFVRRWGTKYGFLTLLGVVAAAVSAFVAKESGEALLQKESVDPLHVFWGNITPLVALGLMATYGLWFMFTRSRAKDAGTTTATPAKTSPIAMLFGGLSVLLALGVIVLAVVVGHSGATKVWAAANEPTASASPSASPSAAVTSATPSAAASSASSSASPSASSTAEALTMANVSTHNSATSCWTVINGNVYDLTSWIKQHPGGSSVILNLCGKDGTAAFTAEHGTQRSPNSTLAGFKLGPLAG